MVLLPNQHKLYRSMALMSSEMLGSSNSLPIGQSARGSSKDTEATVRRKIRKRDIQLPSQRRVLAQRRGVREPCYTYTPLRPETRRSSGFLASLLSTLCVFHCLPPTPFQNKTEYPIPPSLPASLLTASHSSQCIMAPRRFSTRGGSST